MLPDRPWNLDAVLRLLMLMLMSFSGGLFIVQLSAKPLAEALHLELEFVGLVLGFLFFQGLGLLWISMLAGEHGVSWAEAFGFRHKPIPSVLRALFTTAVALPCALIVVGGAVLMLYKLLEIAPATQLPVAFIKRQPPGWQLAVMAFTAVVLAPLMEEALFRGVIYPTLKQRGYPRLAFWGNSALFAMIHFNLAALLPLFFLALVWTWLYERTGNLLASITGHMLFNAVNFVLLVWGVPAPLERLFNP